MGLILFSMGVLAFFALWVFHWKKSNDFKIIVMLLATLVFVGISVFVINYCPSETIEFVDTYQLKYVEQNEQISSKEEFWIELDEGVKLKVNYELSQLQGENKYIFIDDKGTIYYVADNSIKIFCDEVLLTNKIQSIKSENVEVIKGNYETPYLERHVKKAEETFYSLKFEKHSYKIYIPDENN